MKRLLAALKDLLTAHQFHRSIRTLALPMALAAILSSSLQIVDTRAQPHAAEIFHRLKLRNAAEVAHVLQNPFSLLHIYLQSRVKIELKTISR